MLRSFFGFPAEGAVDGDAFSIIVSDMKDTSLLGPEVLDHLPIKIQLSIELNKQQLDEVHSCEISHDTKSQVFRLMNDRPVSFALKGYNLLIEGWKKRDEGLVVMICTGTQRVGEMRGRKRSREFTSGADQENREFDNAFSPEAIALAMTSFLQSEQAQPMAASAEEFQMPSDAFFAQLFASNPALDLSNVDLNTVNSLAEILSSNPELGSLP